MLKLNKGIFFIAACFGLALLVLILWGLVLKAQPARAGSGPLFDIPFSTNIPVMDGVCNPSEYSDAAVVTVTVSTNHPFPIYIKQSATDIYFCYGGTTGLPLPINNSDASVAVYVDPDDDSGGAVRDDYGVWMPYDTTIAPYGPFAHTWITDTYNGPDPLGWQAVKYQTATTWSVEFKLSRQTMGIDKHMVGLALFYHWYSAVSDDYSWPANGIWANPPAWANAGTSLKLYLPLLVKQP